MIPRILSRDSDEFQWNHPGIPGSCGVNPPCLSCLPSPSSIEKWVLWKKIPQVWISLVGLFARVVSSHNIMNHRPHIWSVFKSPVGWWWVRGLYDFLLLYIGESFIMPKLGNHGESRFETNFGMASCSIHHQIQDGNSRIRFSRYLPCQAFGWPMFQGQSEYPQKIWLKIWYSMVRLRTSNESDPEIPIDPFFVSQWDPLIFRRRMILRAVLCWKPKAPSAIRTMCLAWAVPDMGWKSLVSWCLLNVDLGLSEFVDIHVELILSGSVYGWV